MPQNTVAKGSSRGNNAKAAPQKPSAKPPNIEEFIIELTPVLEPYGYNEADIRALVARCGNNKIQVQEAVAHVLEDCQGHEHGEWSNIDTKVDKKEKSAMAKERKAQREKEKAEEEEREKQRRQARLEEEKKRHLEKAARQEALIHAQKKQPGSALVRGSAPPATTNAWRPVSQEEPPIDAVTEVVDAPNEQAQITENRSSNTDTSIPPAEDQGQEPNARIHEYKEEDYEPTTNCPDTVGATSGSVISGSPELRPVKASEYHTNSDSEKADALRDFGMRLVQLEGACDGDATRIEMRALWRCLARLMDQQGITFGMEPQAAQEDTWTASPPHASSSSTAMSSTNNGIAPQTQQSNEELGESLQAACDSKGEAGDGTTDDGKGKKGRSSRSKGDSKGEKGEKGDSKGEKGEKGGGKSERRGKGKAWRSNDREKGKGKSQSS